MSTIHATYALAPRSTRLRLTRRGRLVIVTFALGVLIALAVAFGSSATQATDQSGSIETVTITVQPGQTLWSIAGQANPGGNPHDTVEDIVRLNALPSASIQMGDRIAVPVYGD